MFDFLRVKAVEFLGGRPSGASIGPAPAAKAEKSTNFGAKKHAGARRISAQKNTPG
jgi:hypothetical protein